MERSHMIDYLTGADQEIPNWLIKISLPGEGQNCSFVGLLLKI